MAVKFFNLDAVQGSVDAEGYECFQGMDPDLLYRTENSLRKQGLGGVSKDPYPGPFGGSLYYDDTLWKLTRELSDVEGRNIELMQIALWEKLSEIFDMTEYQPRGEEKKHFLGRAISMQRLFFDARNKMIHAKDRTKKDVQNATEQLPRAYVEWVALQKELTGTVRAMEMAYGEKEGSEENEGHDTISTSDGGFEAQHESSSLACHK